MNYEKPEYTHWHYEKPTDKGSIFTSLSEKYEPYYFEKKMSPEIT
jgi:hypothetical protein